MLFFQIVALSLLVSYPSFASTADVERIKEFKEAGMNSLAATAEKNFGRGLFGPSEQVLRLRISPLPATGWTNALEGLCQRLGLSEMNIERADKNWRKMYHAVKEANLTGNRSSEASVAVRAVRRNLTHVVRHLKHLTLFHLNRRAGFGGYAVVDTIQAEVLIVVSGPKK